MFFNYFTYLVYSPRGKSQNAQQSRLLLGACKNGSLDFGEKLAKNLIRDGQTDFFENSVLIPIPRSSLMVEGAIFPSKILCESLLNNGISNTISDCLKRTHAITKSSSQYSAELRNSVETHLNSLSVTPELLVEPNLILVDDVFTLGRTAMASALKLRDVFPDKNIKIFCPFRTRSFEDNDLLIRIEYSKMILSNNKKVILPD